MYKKINPNMNFVEREEKVLKFWKENRIFEKTLEDQGRRRVFVL